MNLSAGLDPSAYPAAVQTALATMGVSRPPVLDPWDGVEHQMSLDDLMAATRLAVSQGDYFVART